MTVLIRKLLLLFLALYKLKQISCSSNDSICDMLKLASRLSRTYEGLMDLAFTLQLTLMKYFSTS